MKNLLTYEGVHKSSESVLSSKADMKHFQATQQEAPLAM